MKIDCVCVVRCIDRYPPQSYAKSPDFTIIKEKFLLSPHVRAFSFVFYAFLQYLCPRANHPPSSYVMKKSVNVVRFDWAVKRLLRNKASYEVLEGFLESLIGEPITIVEIMESEGNQEHSTDKFNRVDLKARNSKGEIVIIEVQNTFESDYIQRILYGAAKAITEQINLGDRYTGIAKVYSISILYCDFGVGSDYVYHGQTTFMGLHTNDALKVSDREDRGIRLKTPEEIYPEYYLIRVKEFDKVAVEPLEQWVSYLKTGTIPEDADAPGLKKAKEMLDLDRLDRKVRDAYIKYSMDRASFEASIEENFREGHARGVKKGLEEGRKEGLKEGLEKGREEGIKEGIKEGISAATREIAARMKSQGIDPALIMAATGLSAEDVQAL